MVSLPALIDRAVGLVSPVAEARRLAARAVAGDLRRAYYAGAKTTPTSGAWSPVGASINTIGESDRATLTSRARQLVRDQPHVARGVRCLVDLVVGPGITVEPDPRDPTTGEPLEPLAIAWAQAWQRWQDKADAAGRLHFGELQALARRGEGETGESFTLKRVSPDAFTLLPLEPEQVGGLVRAPTAAGHVDVSQGVAYDTRTGRALAYYVTDGDVLSEPRRVDADQVVHPFESLRPGQVRGITPLAPVLMLSHSLRDYLEAEIDGAKLAAKWLAFVKSPDPVGAMAGHGATEDATFERKVTDIGNALVEYLAPGEEVTFASSNRPGSGFTPFVRFCLQSMASVMGVSYELLSGDYAGTNYTVLRGIRNDLSKSVAVLQTRFARQYLEPIYRTWLDWAVLTRRVDAPADYWARRWSYGRTAWTGPGMPQVDPYKEGKADAEAVAAKLKSPQESIRARGADPERVVAELTRWADLVAPLAPAPTATPGDQETKTDEG